jgi:hypothetical protein
MHNNLILMTILNIGTISKRTLSVTTKGSRVLIKIKLEYKIRDTVKTGFPEWR